MPALVFVNDGLNQPPLLDAIPSQTVDEETTLSFVITATDPNAGDVLTFGLQTGAASGASIDPITGAFTWTPSEAQGPGAYDVMVWVTDDGTPNLSDLERFTIIVWEVNLAPALDPINDRSVDEGSNLSVPVTASDPDLPPNTLTFSLDGAVPVAAQVDSASGTFAWTPDDGPSTASITLRVTDDGSPGLSDTQTFTVTVNNVAPEASIAGPAVGVCGQPRWFTLSALDPSIADSAAGFQYVIDWSDGSASETIYGLSGVPVSHIFTESGTFPVQVTATDKDGGTSRVAAHSIAISGLALQPDPADPGQTSLVIGGSLGDDRIKLTARRSTREVFVRFNGESFGPFSPTAGIVVYGQAGNDRIVAGDGIRLPAMLVGGKGDDTLVGGAGSDILLGNQGHDALRGNSGNDLLIGGAERDMLSGGAGQDIVLGETTEYDAQEVALKAILDEWNSQRQFNVRLQNLSDGSGSADRRNGPYFLRQDSILPDDDRDILLDNSGRDWLALFHAR